MKQNRKLLVFLLVIISASIVATGLFFGLRTKSNAVITEPLWQKIGNDIDGEESDNLFGSSVSFSSDGKTVAVGAPWNGGNGDYSGHVRIFQWIESNSTWTQVGADIDGEETYDLFGRSVSLSSDGKTVAIGAKIFPGRYGVSSNYVRIFQWTESTSTWTQMGADIDGAEYTGYDSGTSVSLSSDGKTVAIGAPSNEGNGSDSGHVRIFQWTESTSTWTQMGANIDGEETLDKFGTSVSLSSDGKTVAIGAPWNDGNGVNSGHVRIFQWIESTSTWTQVGADIDGEAPNDRSGESVSLSSDGKTVAIGAPSNGGNGFVRAGHVRIFQRND
jgi:hypothetical protein